MILASAIAFVFWFIAKNHFPNRLKKLKWVSPWEPYLAPALMFAGTSTLAASIVGDWVVNLLIQPVTNLLAWLVNLIPGAGISGALIATLVVTFLVIAAVCDLWDGKVDSKVTRPALIAVPFIAAVAIGPIAGAMEGVTGRVADVTQQTTTSVIPK